MGTTNEFVSLDLSDVHDIFIRDGYTYKPFGSRAKPEYAVFVEGMDDTAAKYANILAISLFNIKQYYDEKYDRNNFIKNVVLDNVLPGDIVIKARELHFNAEVSRVVLLVRIVSANDVSAYDVIQNLFPDKNKTLSLPFPRRISFWSRKSRVQWIPRTWKSWHAPLQIH